MTILRYIRSLLLAVVFLGLADKAAAQKWVTPTPEELAMTSVPEAPGASAVILSREQVMDNSLHTVQLSIRIKVLTTGGFDYANVNIPYLYGEGFNLKSVAGRTILPNGVITQFEGKIRDGVVVKQGGLKVKQKSFTLPNVAVGCILEYRYEIYYASQDYHPQWQLQGNLFERSAHYTLRVYHLVPGVVVAWSSVLPQGVAVTRERTKEGTDLKLELQNLPPMPHEDYMPPEANVGYHVNFYYTGYRTQAEFWTKEGAEWAQDRDQFIGPGPGVKDFVAKLMSPGDSQQLTLRKIYAAVEKLENTEFTRQRTGREDAAQGLKPEMNTDDVLARGRGNAYTLTALFVAMARAAGMKAYLMAVADRSEHMFSTSYLSFSQLDDVVAIVQVNGAEQFFDPGAGACAYGELAWYDSESGGLRQSADGGGALARTPNMDYKSTGMQRIADLTLDEHGMASGKVKLIYTGAGAQRLRREKMGGDQTDVEKTLKGNMEATLPEGFEVKLGEIEHLSEPELPLVVHYEVKGTLAFATGKRLMAQADLFESRTKPRFPQALRTLPIDMHYAYYTQDAIRMQLPEGFSIEAAPAAANEKMVNVAAYDLNSQQSGGSITVNRDLVIGKAYLAADQYPALRQFFGAVEAKDQDKVVLIRSSGAAPGGM